MLSFIYQIPLFWEKMALLFLEIKALWALQLNGQHVNKVDQSD